MKIRKDDILLILLSLLFASCRVGKAEPVADPMEEEGISVVRYDKLLDEYVRFNSFSALQKMNLEYALPTKLLIEDVLALGRVEDPAINEKLCSYYSDSTLVQIMNDANVKFKDMSKIEKGLTSGFRNLKEELPELIATLRKQRAICPASVFSHLCVADDPAQDDYTRGQFAYFDECCDMLQAAFPHHIMRHILNTAGILRFPEHQYDLVRLGIGLYGMSPITDKIDTVPVSSLYTVIISIKEWPAGTTIGYGRNGLLKRPSRIATVPVGYADGIDRHFGNGNINMLVNGTLCPTVGNICMDVCMIDVTDAPGCKVGDQIEIFGRNISVEELARVRGTISYEVLTSISERVKRVYFRE